MAVGKSLGRAGRRVRLVFTSSTLFDDGPLSPSVGKRSGVCSSKRSRPMRFMLPRCRPRCNFVLAIRGEPPETIACPTWDGM